jgi:hypothetical protein
MARRFAAVISHAADCQGYLLRATLKGRNQRVLGKFLGNADIAGDAAIAAMSRVDSIFHTASIVLWTSLMFALILIVRQAKSRYWMYMNRGDAVRDITVFAVT